MAAMDFDWAFKPRSHFSSHRAQAEAVLLVVPALLRTADRERMYHELGKGLSHPPLNSWLGLLDTPDEVMSLLYAQDLVAAWSTLETLVRDTARSWLTHVDATWELPALQNIKGELIPFARLTHEEQADYIVDLIQRDPNAIGKRKLWGIERLEALLAAFGLDTWPLNAETKTALFELGLVRNVWAHASGVADSTFVEAAPHLGWREGERVLLRRAQYERYAGAIQTYSDLLGTRTLERLQNLRLTWWHPTDDQPHPPGEGEATASSSAPRGEELADQRSQG